MTDPHTSNTLGIDFGTSNSAAGVLVNSKPHLIEFEPGQKTMPTSLFFDFDKRQIVYGTVANSALRQGKEGRFMRSLKSVLGTSLMREERRVMGETLTFVDIISRYLAEMKSRAETACYQTFDHALSGRPVHFHSADATKDKQALVDLTECYHAAGFKSVRFLPEPEAAAIANGAIKTPDAIGLIVDIGGGTSDFSLFRTRADGHGIKILASHGVRVGGTNFDKSISVDHVMPLLGKGAEIRKEMGPGLLNPPQAIYNDLATWEMIPFMYAPEVRRLIKDLHRLAVQPALFQRLQQVLDLELGHDLAFAVERGKIDVNKNDRSDAKIDIHFVEPGLGVNLTARDLVASLVNHVDDIRDAAAETVARATLNPSQITNVIFVGGSSLMQVVQGAMADMFPSAILQYSDAFTGVVNGLAIAADKQE